MESNHDGSPEQVVNNFKVSIFAWGETRSKNLYYSTYLQRRFLACKVILNVLSLSCSLLRARMAWDFSQAFCSLLFRLFFILPPSHFNNLYAIFTFVMVSADNICTSPSLLNQGVRMSSFEPTGSSLIHESSSPIGFFLCNGIVSSEKRSYVGISY